MRLVVSDAGRYQRTLKRKNVTPGGPDPGCPMVEASFRTRPKSSLVTVEPAPASDDTQPMRANSSPKYPRHPHGARQARIHVLICGGRGKAEITQFPYMQAPRLRFLPIKRQTRRREKFLPLTQSQVHLIAHKSIQLTKLVIVVHERESRNCTFQCQCPGNGPVQQSLDRGFAERSIKVAPELPDQSHVIAIETFPQTTQILLLPHWFSQEVLVDEGVDPPANLVIRIFPHAYLNQAHRMTQVIDRLAGRHLSLWPFPHHEPNPSTLAQVQLAVGFFGEVIQRID